MNTHLQSVDDQDLVCGNEFTGPTDGDPDAPCGDDVPNGDGLGDPGGDSLWGSRDWTGAPGQRPSVVDAWGQSPVTPRLPALPSISAGLPIPSLTPARTSATLTG